MATRSPDSIVGLNGTEITLQTAQQAFGQLHVLEAGQEFTMEIVRAADAYSIPCSKQLVDKVDRHVFRIDPNASAEQIELRNAWLKNLPVSK